MDRPPESETRCGVCGRLVKLLQRAYVGDQKRLLLKRASEDSSGGIEVRSEVFVLICESCARGLRELQGSESRIGPDDLDVNDEPVSKSARAQWIGAIERSRTNGQSQAEQLAEKTARRTKGANCPVCRRVIATTCPEDFRIDCKMYPAPGSDAGAVPAVITIWTCEECAESDEFISIDLHADIRLDFDPSGSDSTTRPKPAHRRGDKARVPEVYPNFHNRFGEILTSPATPYEIAVLRSAAALEGFIPASTKRNSDGCEQWQYRGRGITLKLPHPFASDYGTKFGIFASGIPSGFNRSSSWLVEELHNALADASDLKSRDRIRDPGVERLSIAKPAFELKANDPECERCWVCDQKVPETHAVYSREMGASLNLIEDEEWIECRRVGAELVMLACTWCADQIQRFKPFMFELLEPSIDIERLAWERWKQGSPSEAILADQTRSSQGKINESQVCGSCRRASVALDTLAFETYQANHSESLCLSHSGDCEFDADIVLEVCHDCSKAAKAGFLYLRAELELRHGATDRRREPASWEHHSLYFWTPPVPLFDADLLRAAAALVGYLPARSLFGKEVRDAHGLEVWKSEHGTSEVSIPNRGAPHFEYHFNRFAHTIWPEPIVAWEPNAERFKLPPSRIGRRLIEALDRIVKEANSTDFLDNDCEEETFGTKNFIL